MKRAFILILLLPIWVGCNKNGDVRNKEFTDTGCALGARDAFSLWNSYPEARDSVGKGFSYAFNVEIGCRI